jgi:hypothetical protein
MELWKWKQKHHGSSFNDGTLLGESDNLLGYLELLRVQKLQCYCH